MLHDWRNMTKEEIKEALQDQMDMMVSHLAVNPTPCLICGAGGELYVYSTVFCEPEELTFFGMDPGQVRATAFCLCDKCRNPMPDKKKLADYVARSVRRGTVKDDIGLEFN